MEEEIDCVYAWWRRMDGTRVRWVSEGEVGGQAGLLPSIHRSIGSR